MDMKKMLAALDGVESAEGTASSVAQKGSMKSLLESLDSVVAEEVAMEEVEEELEEGRMSDQLIHDAENMSREEFEKKHGKEAAKDMFDESVEETEEVVAEEELEEAIMVSAGGGEAAELLAILQNAGMSAPAMPEPEMDMQDEYSNSPDEVEMDLDAVIASGDDLHKDKEQFAAAASGDNPMKAFEGKFKAMLDELLAEDSDVTEEEEVVAEAQSPAQKAAFEKMLAAKKGNKADDKDDEDKDEADESVEEAVAVNESAEFSDMKHFMQRLNG